MQLDPTKPPDSGIVLEVEARNANGTVGATLFSNFSSSFNSTTGLVTFTANSPFELTAGTGYWLVLSDPTRRRCDLGLHGIECLPIGVRLRPAVVQHLVVLERGQRPGKFDVLPAVGRSPALRPDRACDRFSFGTVVGAPSVHPAGDPCCRDGCPACASMPVPAHAGKTGHASRVNNPKGAAINVNFCEKAVNVR